MKLNLPGFIATTLVLFPTVLLAQPQFDSPWRAFESSPTSESTGRFLVDTASGDLNGDGLDDIVAGQAVFTGGIRVFLNAGQSDGPPATFEEPAFYPVSNGAWGVVIVDVDGDGDLDIATSDTDINGSVSRVAILLNDGSGIFGVASYYPAGSAGPTGITAADLDGDGDTDLAVANWGLVGFGSDISVLLNDGTGAFSVLATYDVLVGPHSIEAGDLDGDDVPDLVVGHDDDAAVSVLFGAGDGTFGAPVVYAGIFNIVNTGAWASVALLDTEFDGDLDIAFTSSYAYDQSQNDGLLAILHNDGTGAFTVDHYSYGTPYQNVAIDLSVADLNGDPYPDLIGAQYYEAGYLTFLADGLGGYELDASIPSADDVIGTTAADLDGDGDSDVATVNRLYPLVGAHENLGNGDFERLPIYGDVFLHYVLDLGDINGDGHLDAVTSHSGATCSSVNVFLGAGDGTFSQSYVTGGTGYGYAKLRHLDDDEWLDLLFVSGPGCTPYDFFTAHGNGDGTFGPVIRWPVGTCGSAHPAAFDLDHDGDLDVINTEDRGCIGDPNSGRRIYVSLNNGNGTFQPAYTVTAGQFPRNVDAGDLNEDGHVDLAIVCSGTDAILFGNGDGSFQPWVSSPLDFLSDNILVGDWDGDAHQDVAALAHVSSGVAAMGILWGDGSGGFDAQRSGHHAAVNARQALTSGDMDGDGDDDLFLDGVQDVIVFENEGNRQISTAGRYGIGRDSRGIVFGDATNDGIGDIVALITSEQPSGLYGGVTVLPGIGSDPAGVEDNELGFEVGGFSVGAVQPHPFKSRGHLQLRVEQTQEVSVDLIDVVGRKIGPIFSGSLEAGTSHDLVVDGSALSAGVYWVAVRGETFETTRRVVVVR